MNIKVCSSAVSLALALSLVDVAVAQEGTSPTAPAILTIESESVASAIDDWSRITGYAVVWDEAVANGALSAVVQGVNGTYTPLGALERLLSTTGLRYRVIGERSVAIEAFSVKKTSATGAEAATQAQGVVSDENTPASVPQHLATAEEPQSVADSDAAVHMPEVLIKGAATSNVDIKRTQDDVQPYYIFDATTIKQSGASTVEDFLKQRLTMNAQFQTNSQGYANGLPTYSSINLRGLGTNETLILIDGRRTASTYINNTQYQPDINGIPLAAIERIEVLPSSASAIYGGAAMGGVINIILKKNYNGGELSYTREDTFQGSAPLNTVNATYGFSLEGGRTNVMLAGNFSNGSALQVRDRLNIIGKGLSTIMANSPATLYSPTEPFLGGSTNIASANGDNLTLKGGNIPLNSPITFIPRGAAPGAVPASALVANAGSYDLSIAPGAGTYGLQNPIGTVPENKSAMVSVRRQFTDDLTLFADYSNKSDFSRVVDGQFNDIYTVPGSAPTNPFNQDVLVTFPTAFAVPITTNSVTHSVTAGAIAHLFSDWNAEFDYTWSHNSLVSVTSTGDTNSLDTALAAGTVNPFADTIANPLNLAPYLQNIWYSNSSTLNDFGLRLSGSLLELPWGAPTLTVGLEHRKEASNGGTTYNVYTANPDNNYERVDFPQSQSINSIYAEAVVPIVTSKNALPGLQALELQLAGRTEWYSVDAGTGFENLSTTNPSIGAGNPPQGLHEKISYNATSPTAGFKYKPVDDVALRVSYAKAFLPPTFAQLLPNPVLSTITERVTDPNNGQTYRVHYYTGGNPDLQPQRAENWDFGVILEPQEAALKGVRVDFEYYRIKQPNYITLPAPQEIVSNPAYASRVTRDPTTGLITTINQSYVNAEQYKTDGFDLTLGYHRETSLGTFDFTAYGTYIAHDQRQYTVGGALVDYAGYPAEGGEAKLKGNATLSWEYRGWNLGWTTTYLSSYYQELSPGSPGTIQYGTFTLFTAPQGGNSIPSQTYHSIFGGYTFAQSWGQPLAGLTLQFGIKNLFNTLPPFDAFNYPYYYSSYGDPRLRDYWLTVRKAL